MDIRPNRNVVAWFALFASPGCLLLGGCSQPDSAQADGPIDPPVAVAPVRPASAFVLPRPPESRAFESWTLRETAEDAVSRIGPAAVPELRRWLNDANPTIRREAADLVGRIGPEASEAIPDLIILLDDEDAEVRKYAARALGRIGAGAGESVPALMRVLREELIKEQTRVQESIRR